MPKVEKRIARKDYPSSGIVKGDTYYYTSLKLQRGGQVKRSKTPFKPSQLTNSPFKSGFLATEEAWSAGSRDGDAMREAAQAIRELGEECQSSFDNMPEGLQQGDTGQSLENRASECERIADELEGFADEWDGLEDPGEFEGIEPIEPLGDLESEEENEAAEEAYNDAQDAYDLDEEEHNDLVSEYESEQERLQGEADSLLGDMPE